jgi:hypothetical protein
LREPEVLCGHGGRLADERRALQSVFELAHVARPFVIDERLPRVGRKRVRNLALGGVPREHALRERQDVVGPVAKGRHGQLDDVEAEVEVLAERALRDGARQIGVRRADEADVGLARDVAAEPLEFARLQDAQELHLSRGREIADLVEEERAAVGFLETADAQLFRARIGARLGAEKLGLEQLVGQAAGVDLDERLVASARIHLHDLREALLARSVRSRDEDRRLGRRDLDGERHDFVHRRALVDETSELVRARELGSRAAGRRAPSQILLRELAQTHQVFHGGDELVVVPRLGGVVARAAFDETHGRFEGLEGRHQKNG